LKLYLFENPKDPLQRLQNKEVTKMANAILSQKVVDQQYSNHGLINPKKGKVGLLSFFKTVMEKKRESVSNYNNFQSCYKHLSKYLELRDVPLENVDEVLLDGFKDYLLKEKIGRANKPLSPNSALSYQIKLKIVLKEAYRQKYMRENITAHITNIKGKDTNRQYLTWEELQLLMNTPCEIAELKQMFLFSCLTGMRWSDTVALKWEKIHYNENSGWYIDFKQQKTQSHEIHPVTEHAITLLPKKDDPQHYIFSLKYSAHLNHKLERWLWSAGISKKITYHCSRHTFAVMMLSHTDIYTVSKLLTHKNLKTTEGYAKVTNQRKIEATDKIPLLSNHIN
jgi:integrase